MPVSSSRVPAVSTATLIPEQHATFRPPVTDSILRTPPGLSWGWAGLGMGTVPPCSPYPPILGPDFSCPSWLAWAGFPGVSSWQGHVHSQASSSTGCQPPPSGLHWGAPLALTGFLLPMPLRFCSPLMAHSLLLTFPEVPQASWGL